MLDFLPKYVLVRTGKQLGKLSFEHEGKNELLAMLRGMLRKVFDGDYDEIDPDESQPSNTLHEWTAEFSLSHWSHEEGRTGADEWMNVTVLIRP